MVTLWASILCLEQFYRSILVLWVCESVFGYWSSLIYPYGYIPTWLKTGILCTVHTEKMGLISTNDRIWHVVKSAVPQEKSGSCDSYKNYHSNGSLRERTRDNWEPAVCILQFGQLQRTYKRIIVSMLDEMKEYINKLFNDIKEKTNGSW